MARKCPVFSKHLSKWPQPDDTPKGFHRWKIRIFARHAAGPFFGGVRKNGTFFFLHGESSERTHTHTLKLFLLLLFFTSLHFALLLRWPAPKPPHSLWVKNRLTCLCAAEPNSAAQQTRTTTTSHHQAGAERTQWNEGMRSFSCSFARARTQMKFWEARQGDLKVRGRFY